MGELVFVHAHTNRMGLPLALHAVGHLDCPCPCSVSQTLVSSVASTCCRASAAVRALVLYVRTKLAKSIARPTANSPGAS